MLILSVAAWGDIQDAPVDSVVRLSVPGGGSGTGFLMGDGRMVTAKHVAINCDMAMVAQFSDGTVEIITAPQISMSDDYDIAVIDDVKKKGKLLTIYDGDMYIGYPIYTLSMPYSYDIRFGSVGVVGSERCTLITPQWTWTNVRMTDLHAVGGMSGGPVFNNADEVVGIVVANAEVIVLIVDNKTIQEFLDETTEKSEAKSLP
jgi:V8-like Glu-specific endopeptidase